MGSYGSADLKQFVGAIALIRRDVNGGNRWLVQWNEGRDCLQLIEAHKLPDETFRESLVREVEWGTGLRTGKDYLVSNTPRAHLEIEAPGGSGEQAMFIVEFFLVELMGRSAADVLDADPRNEWVSAEELHAGRSTGGRALCATQCRLLSKAGVISPWES